MRSPWRLTLFLVLAVPAILLSVDMLISHRWVPKPATYTATVGETVDDQGSVVPVTAQILTHDGRAEWRRDRAFGSLLLAGGLGTMAFAVAGLLRPRPVLRASDEGISVRVDGWGHPPRLFPWESIVEVRSGVRDVDGAEIPVLSILLDDPTLVPFDPAGAVEDSPWLHIWAEDWDRPVHQIAPLLDPRRRRRLGPAAT
jgi:hypothetical protein